LARSFDKGLDGSDAQAFEALPLCRDGVLDFLVFETGAIPEVDFHRVRRRLGVCFVADERAERVRLSETRRAQPSRRRR